MIRTTPQRRYRVSNQTALLAALFLGVSSFAGFSNSSNQPYADNASAAVSQVNETASTQTSNKRKLNLSLLLVGRG